MRVLDVLVGHDLLETGVEALLMNRYAFSWPSVREDDENAVVGEEEEVQDVERGAGAGGPAGLSPRPGSPGAGGAASSAQSWVWPVEEVLGAADEVQVGDGGLDDDVVDVLHTPVQEVRQRHLAHADAEGGMEVGPAQVRVTSRTFFFDAGEGDADVAGDQLLPIPPLPPAADAPRSPFSRGLPGVLSSFLIILPRCLRCNRFFRARRLQRRCSR